MVLLSASMVLAEGEPAVPHPVDNPHSPLMLAGEWVPDDPQTIDFAGLPRVPGEHDGHLLVAFSGGKQSVEVLKIRLVDLKQIAN